MGAAVLLGVLFFFVVCLGASDSIRKTVLAAAVVALLAIAVRFKVLCSRISWPFIALTLVVLMDGVSTFYAVSGKFALREFLKVFLAYLLAVILLAASQQNEQRPGKRIAIVLASCAAVGSIVSIDLISTRILSGAAAGILSIFTDNYAALEGVSPGTRITTFFDNSNVFAGCSGLGLLLSAGLAETSDSAGERRLFVSMLFVNALAFLLTFSMGAILFAVLSCIVLIVMTPAEKRAGLILLFIETLVLLAASAALISATSFQAWSGFQPIPLLCAVLGTAVLCLADRYVGQKLAARIQVRWKTALILILAVLILAAAFAVTAWNLTGDVTLSAGNQLMRAAYPKPGDYTLTVQSRGSAPDVRIRSRNWQESAANRDTILYTGPAEDASFTVPEDSIVVYFDFSTQDETRIVSASFGDYKIPLRYLLLPSFIANRLQGALASHSVVQRIVYFQDGMKLFRRSPVVGLGMGAFENGIMSVQTYHYETKYAHNHYIQTLIETGVIGLLLFLFLLVSSGIALRKARGAHPYIPMLTALLVFMAGQALHDIVFSSYAYLPLAYGSFALIDLCCGNAVTRPKLTRTARGAAAGLIALCTVIYCAFLAGNLIARHKVEENPSFETLVQGVNLDRFEWADYALPYVTNAIGNDIDPEIRNQANQYARRLAKVNSNTIPIYLAEYYFSNYDMELGFRMLEKYVDYVASNQAAWQSAFSLLQKYETDSDAYREGVSRMVQKLKAWNDGNQGRIELSKETQAFLARYE